MITDTGIVTIYDLDNDGAPLTTHRVDAKEFLAHPAGRWSTSPDAKKATVGDAKPIKTETDNGEAMRLKAMTIKQLRAAAEKADIPGSSKMQKPGLVAALMENSAGGSDVE